MVEFVGDGGADVIEAAAPYVLIALWAFGFGANLVHARMIRQQRGGQNETRLFDYTTSALWFVAVPLAVLYVAALGFMGSRPPAP